MNDPKKALQNEGFTRREVDLILEKAVALQREAEERDFLERDELLEGAEDAGIRREFIEEAIRQMRETLRVEKAARAQKLRLYKFGGIGAAVLLALLFFYAHSTLNARLSEVEKSRAQLENVLQRRHDLLPNLVSLAKAAAAHEQELIASIARYQDEIQSTDDFTLRQAWEEKLGAAMQELLGALRNTADGGTGMFARLSDEMAGAENRIAVERKRYNEAVAAYNRTARGFFVSLVRPFLGFPKQIPYFAAGEGAHKAPRY